jgi:hypothetical protein
LGLTSNSSIIGLARRRQEQRSDEVILAPVNADRFDEPVAPVEQF